MNIIVALLIFSVIVVAHELGHFFLAKKNGVGVPEFSVGMGPRIVTFAKTANGCVVKFFCSQKIMEEREDWQDVTKYSWKLLPLGGSCAMIGEDEDNDAENSFNSKGKWARFSIVFAGPFFNFILAFLFSIIIIANSGIDYPRVEAVYDNQPAKAAGIQLGDEIKSINGHKISIGREIDTYIQLHPLTGEDVSIVLMRDGEKKTITLDPNYKTHLFGFSYSPQKTESPKISVVSKGKPFDKAGIRAGDKIVSINGTKISNGEELKNVMENYNDGGEVEFEIEQDGEVLSYKVTPEPYETKTLGFYAAGDVKGGNAIDVLKYSLVEVKYWVETTIASLGQLITGKISTKELSGPVGIVDTVGNVLEQSTDYGMRAVILNMLYMSVLLSANLGVMNLLPLPALDGGRLVFIIIEAVRGKPVDRDKEGYVHFAGFVVLMLFMIFVMYNDIIKIIH
ncbi:MAG: RIP metalloprotease RseP [Lachnospiraceae bacterium]|jgi:regulator of sigma E protease|nr:RIP metalloprotease RseP [Lachnospiraceae bacterium]